MESGHEMALCHWSPWSVFAGSPISVLTDVRALALRIRRGRSNSAGDVIGWVALRLEDVRETEGEKKN